AIVLLATAGGHLGEAYNLSQEEELSIDEFLSMLAGLAGTELRLVRVPIVRLEAEGLIPDCSPFSGAWMSALDNGRSKRELRMTSTPLPTYLSNLVAYLSANPRVPIGYRRRELELQIANEAG